MHVTLKKIQGKNIEIRERMEEDDDEDYDMNGNIIHNERARTKIEIDGIEIDFIGNGRLTDAGRTGRNSNVSEDDNANQLDETLFLNFL